MSQSDVQVKRSPYVALLRFLVKNRYLRAAGVRLFDRRLYKFLMEEEAGRWPLGVQYDKYSLLAALLYRLDRIMRRGSVSPRVVDKVIDTIAANVIFTYNARQKAAARKLGFRPPLFVVISPTKRCNLRCTGCYAASDGTGGPQLSWETFSRILREKQQLWESFFTTISGGEPLLWRDNGKGILDIVADFPDQYFLMYTNGTLIDERVAGRMAELGNITPAISVEGFKDETDARRGSGVFARILRAFGNLRRAGVPFGISTTATRHNWDVVTSEEFADYYFERQGAFYGWLFQYMPIGRHHTLDLMVTPEQRLEMFRRIWRLVREKKLFYADFWNSGTATAGCIAGGRSGGYFYITWSGDVTPCVFVPYSTHNINDVYASGGDLNTALLSPLFERIRRWQEEYGYEKAPHEVSNWLAPCAIRDHFDHFQKARSECNARPIDKDAAAAIADPQYCNGLVAYGKAYGNLTREIWDNEYRLPTATERPRVESAAPAAERQIARPSFP